MKVSAEFKDGVCKLSLTPDDPWEKKLLGAVAKGGTELGALVKYTPNGHFSYGECECVEVQLKAVDA